MENNHDEIRNMELAIVRTIAFFDLFDYPLTSYEVWQYLSIKTDLKTVNNVLWHGILGISSRHGFYCLAGKEGLVEIRMNRYNYTDEKMKIALRIVRFFKFIPWIKMIAIANSIGSHNLRSSGDIDFFIITRPNRIWLTRLFCAGSMKLMNLRPTEKNKKNKICLSFYTTTDNLDLSSLRIEDDIKFNYWASFLVPIFDTSSTYEKLVSANAWLINIFPNRIPLPMSFKRRINSRRKDRVNMLFNYLEKLAARFQYAIMPKALKESMNRDNRVIINDGMLKLHVTDNREIYRDRFKEIMKKYEEV